MYFQSLTTEDDLWFIDTYPKEINSKPVNEQLIKDSGLKAVFDKKFRLLLDSKMDIPEDKPEEKKDESDEVGVGSKKSSFLNSLREKHNNEGLIVPHLHFIGDNQSTSVM